MARVAEAHAPPAKGLSGKWMIQRYDLRSARNVSNTPEQFSEWRPCSQSNGLRAARSFDH
jgi:hypothetical protein